MARREFTTHPLVVRRLTVVRTEEVTPRMKRVVVSGDQFHEREHNGYTLAPFTSTAFDDHVKFIFAADGDTDSVLPRQVEHGIEWTGSDNQVLRDYTPRWVDHDRGEIAFDLVMHGTGPAATWGMTARAGDELCFVGPKSSTVLPGNLDWMLMVADETALPALGRFLEERPTDARVEAVVLIEDESAKQDLPLREGDALRWVLSPAGNAEDIDREARALTVPTEGEGYVWAAGESSALLPVRRYFSREVGIARDRLNMTGYWHWEETGENGEAAEGAPAAHLHLDDPIGWFVARALVQLRVIDAIGDHPAGITIEALAAAVGVPSERLRPLLEVAASAGIVTAESDTIRLAALGEMLLDEHEQEELTGFEADAIIALVDLADSVREGTAAWQRQHGRTLNEAADANSELAEQLVEGAAGLRFLLPPYLRGVVDERVSSVALAGFGAAYVAESLLELDREILSLRVLASPSVASAVREVLPDEAPVSFDAAASDLAVIAHGIGHLTDAEARDLLTTMRTLASRLIVIESAEADRLSSAAAAESVLSLATTGAPKRDTERLTSLAGDTGWRRADVVGLGWGVVAISFDG